MSTYQLVATSIISPYSTQSKTIDSFTVAVPIERRKSRSLSSLGASSGKEVGAKFFRTSHAKNYNPDRSRPFHFLEES